MTTEQQRIADLEALVGRLLKRIEALEAWRAGSIPLMQADKPPARSSGRILVDADSRIGPYGDGKNSEGI